VFAGANIELLQFFESRVSDKPCAIGGAIDACVVEDDGVAVAGKAYVDLDAVGADLGGGAEGAQGVFGAFNMMAPVSEDLQSHLLVRRELIAPGFAFEHGLAVLAHDFDFELADRFALVDAHNLSGSGDGVADKDRGGEFPVLAQEDSAGAGHVHGDEGVEQPGGQAALDDEAAELGAGGEGFVEVQGVVVAGDFGKGLDVGLGEFEGAGSFLPDLQIHGRLLA
jgi:hypothetical protein